MAAVIEAGFPCAPSLTRLRLGSTSLGDAAVSALAAGLAHRRLPVLSSLSLVDVNMSSAGAEALFGALAAGAAPS